MTARRALVTGGAGFIGSNLADRLLRDGKEVTLLDALSRPQVEQNVAWLKDRHGDRVRLLTGDVRDLRLVRAAVADVDQVFHLAAQVAVTRSVDAPRDDFEVNALGTLNVLEALRERRDPPPLVFTSTNKVYGKLEGVPLALRNGRWEPEDEAVATTGLSERQPLAFHSPYGCSKGSADQYVLDYASTYGLPTVVMRMSCVYGPRQLGNEDQGWVAHIVASAHRGDRVVLYGDGRQVRDLLFVDDLVEALTLASDRAPELAGRAFNVGGGPDRALSLLELVSRLRGLGLSVQVRHEDWRVGDQRWYVSDTTSFGEETGWAPRVGLAEGLERLERWIASLFVEPERDLRHGAPAA